MKKGLTKWDKLPVFSSFQDEMNRVLDNFFNRESSYGTDWRPVVDVAETENDIIVRQKFRELTRRISISLLREIN